MNALPFYPLLSSHEVIRGIETPLPIELLHNGHDAVVIQMMLLLHPYLLELYLLNASIIATYCTMARMLV